MLRKPSNDLDTCKPTSINVTKIKRENKKTKENKAKKHSISLANPKRKTLIRNRGERMREITPELHRKKIGR